MLQIPSFNRLKLSQVSGQKWLIFPFAVGYNKGEDKERRDQA